MRLSFVVALVVVVGCQKKTATCESAISGAIDRMVADASGHMPASASENMKRVVPQMKTVIAAACTEDKWAPAVITCIDHARTKQELDACDAQLTPAQKVSERKRQDEILKTAVQPLGGAPEEKHHEPVDPHAGMDMGSAHPAPPKP
jgi:hypothetical protein